MAGSVDDGVRRSVLDAVLEILQTDGYAAVRVRDVARRARVSSATIYLMFSSRDDLIVSALERWMDENVYRGFSSEAPDESLYESVMRQVRAVFEPWEEHPRMLEAFHRARSGPEGERLWVQGVAAAEPMARPPADDEFLEDLRNILGNMIYGLIGRFSDGQISIDEILPAVERAVSRLTRGAEHPDTLRTRDSLAG